LCIDDFGTGYSSLRYLNEMPLSYIKIDRSFVSDGGENLANRPIVEMLMVLSRALHIDVVAEGIETRKQWEALRDLGCRYAQGYVFSVPVEAAALTALLQADVAVLASTPPAFRKALAPA
jgi:EAL domain-containing protein (putative c-di-GMP-specific phosphodiesterase class I)